MKNLITTAALISLAIAPLHASRVLAASVTPPATLWKSSLTEPTGDAGSDFAITKASQAQVKVSAGNVTFQLKLNGVRSGGSPVTQMNNTFEVQMRYHGVVRTQSFLFDLVDGKTINSQTKYVIANGSLPSGGVVSDDSIEILKVRCIQGGSGPGAGSNFCGAGLTAK
jgi:hypothetical protein